MPTDRANWVAIGRYLPIIVRMRRKPGELLPIEQAILAAGLDLRRIGTDEFHGFAVAKRMQDIGEAHQLTAHGTLYKALGRLETSGLLASHWEQADLALEEGRPRRRLYRVTGAGEKALATHHAETGRAIAGPRRGLASS
jgi:PadR family transcriptional regulator PadR